MIPRVLNPQARRKMCFAILSMPTEDLTGDVDRRKSLILYPGSLESRHQFVFEKKHKGKDYTYVIGVFNIQKICRLLDSDSNEIEVIGYLKDSRCFTGTDAIKVLPLK
jgi:hypothetical protein